MSFLARPFVPETTTSFNSLFRLLDDYDNYSQGSGTHHKHSHLRSFSPRFDIKELADAYELHGEFPGIDQKDIDIEFTDPQTITIRGRTERSHTSGTPPTGFIDAGPTDHSITEGQDQKFHQATVEDAGEDSQIQKSQSADNSAVAAQSVDNKNHKEKYWVSERAVGEFARTFAFPTRVDQDAVKATMKNGILSIIVPKLKKQEGRKITIS